VVRRTRESGQKMTVCSGRAIASKRADPLGWMMAITGTMPLRGTYGQQKRNAEIELGGEDNVDLPWICPSLKRLFKDKYNLGTI